MNAVLWMSSIAAVGFVAGPLLSASLGSRQRRMDRTEDIKRLDKVAAATKEVAVMAKLTADEAVNSRSELRSQLVQIHGLVNSNLTDAKQKTLDQARLHLAVLKRIVAMDHGEASAEDAAVIKSTEISIAAMQAEIADRAIQLEKTTEDMTADVEEIGRREGSGLVE